jgi:hypothetical protein
MTNIWSETGKALALKELDTTRGAVTSAKSALWVTFSYGIVLNEALLKLCYCTNPVEAN